MDYIELEEELSRFGIYVCFKPSKEELNQLKELYNVTELNNGQIQILNK